MKELETFYKKHTWLMGGSFIKRAFAIWGYSLAAVGMVYGVMIALAIIVGLVAGILSEF